MLSEKPCAMPFWDTNATAIRSPTGEDGKVVWIPADQIEVDLDDDEEPDEMNPANLLFILSDQHTRDITGCYGHPVVRDAEHRQSRPTRDPLYQRLHQLSHLRSCPRLPGNRTIRPSGPETGTDAFAYDGSVPELGATA